MATDHILDELPYDARLFAIGEPTENCGFAGLTIEVRAPKYRMHRASAHLSSRAGRTKLYGTAVLSGKNTVRCSRF